MRPWARLALPNLLAPLIAACGIVLLVSGVTPAEQARMAVLAQHVPLALIEAAHFIASLCGLVLLPLALGLRRRLDSAWSAAAIVLAAGILLSLLKGLDHKVLAKCRRARIRPNPGAATLVATMKSRGALTVLVSGGFTDFVNPIGRELGFNRMRANWLGVGDDGKLTGQTVGKIVDAAAKRRLAEEILAARKLGPESLVAIGDGANDAPLVELAEDADPLVAIVPDRHGRGTNALLLSPPGVIEFCFGGDSKEAHLGAARAAGARVEVLDGPLSLDIDTPEDLLIAQAETPEVVGG